MDLNLKQVAQRLRVSLEKARTMLHEGRFPNAYKMDASKETSPFFIPERDVKAIEKSRKQGVGVGARTIRS